jgi:hypothetical protein
MKRGFGAPERRRQRERNDESPPSRERNDAQETAYAGARNGAALLEPRRRPVGSRAEPTGYVRAATGNLVPSPWSDEARPLKCRVVNG